MNTDIKARICPQCGDTIEVELPAACESCGVWLEPPIDSNGREIKLDNEGNPILTCEECGVGLAEEDKFCRECGQITDLGQTVEAIDGFGEEHDDPMGWSFTSNVSIGSTNLLYVTPKWSGTWGAYTTAVIDSATTISWTGPSSTTV